MSTMAVDNRIVLMASHTQKKVYKHSLIECIPLIVLRGRMFVIKSIISACVCQKKEVKEEKMLRYPFRRRCLKIIK